MEDKRPEGVYCSWETYPPHSGLKNNIFVIERVAGDGSVSRFECASLESEAIIDFLVDKS